MKKIEDIKNSLRRSRNVSYVLGSLSELEGRYKVIEDSELLEYVPVKIISCFEEHFRQIYKDIIARKEYRDNVKKVKCLKEMRFNLDFITSMQYSEVTVEDFLSYNFPCSSIDHVMDSLGTLLDINFQERLIDKIIEIEGKADVPEKEGRDQVYYYILSIGKIFEMRHIICHEGGLAKKLDNSFVMQMIYDAQFFVEAIDKLLFDIFYPGETMTQLEMNEESAKAFKDADMELKSLVRFLQSNVTGIAPNFGFMDSWMKYREQKAKADSYSCEGGSMHPTIYALSMESTTRQMISQLKKEYRLYDWEWKKDNNINADSKQTFLA